MDPDSIQARYTAQIIAKLEGVVANALRQERRQWAESYQALQLKLEDLRSENVRLNIQVQSHQLESTNRALWLKRKAESDTLDSRPAKLSRRQEPPSQGFAPPTPNSSRALSADVDGEVEGLQIGVWRQIYFMSLWRTSYLLLLHARLTRHTIL
ncbi:hypothetical protein FS749_004491 [Ceratobasidium sp. UAMH 11750]|nr:hypothetical protein FS749_004491 [Ceratobasidium sp. UAMH 11750]